MTLGFDNTGITAIGGVAVDPNVKIVVIEPSTDFSIEIEGRLILDATVSPPKLWVFSQGAWSHLQFAW
jgi:hypothetical protein